MDAKKQKQTILCTWEIGGELGHVSRYSDIVRALEAEGYHLVVALKDLSRAYPFFCDTQAILLQAPTWLPQISMQRPIACLADSLLLLGYLETDPLHALVLAWQNLIDMVQPDLVIFDYAPTAMLALLQRPLPKIRVGTGFSDPVPGSAIVDWRPFVAGDELVARQEQRVLQQINAVLARQGKTAVAYLGDLFAVDRTLISTFPELDLYRRLRRDTDYCFARRSPQQNPQVQFGRNGQPRILVYLKTEYPQFEQLVAALAGCKASVFIACPMGRPEQFQAYLSDNFQVSTTLVNLQDAMQQADLFVCHGNNASLTESLVAGVAPFILPIQLEQLLSGKTIRECGFGVLLEQISTVEALTALLEQALLERELYRAAIAQMLARYPEPRLSLSVAVKGACAELLGRD